MGLGSVLTFIRFVLAAGNVQHSSVSLSGPAAAFPIRAK
jgi:hypothetical protein